MKNIWLEVDEPRKRFFKVAYKLISQIETLTRFGKLDKLYSLYADFVHAYKKLDVLLRLYDREVITTFDGIEAALNMYCPNDHVIDQIFMCA